MTDIQTAPKAALPAIAWLWIPVAAVVIQIILELSLSSKVLGILHSENGPHEILQFLVTAAACGVAVMSLKLVNRNTQKWLYVWLGLAAICCFYVAGEEISWGQHFASWNTPEFWTTYNDQQETNLHNVSSWFDQKPRLILEISVLTGGIIIPLLLKFKPTIVPQKFTIIYPPACLALIAALAIGGKIVVKIAESYDVILFSRFSEVEELFLFYFVFLYLIALKRRLASA